MKRKWAYLALPLLLAAGIFGAKWRAEHPTPTEEDLELRALMSKSFTITVAEPLINPPTMKYIGMIPNTESQLFINSLFTLSKKSQHQNFETGMPIVVTVEWLIKNPAEDGTKSIDININPQSYSTGGIINSSLENRRRQINLHPVTVKRWVELLLANPRIGPELRARMK